MWQVTPILCQCCPLLCVESRAGVPGELARALSYTHAHSFLRTQGGPKGWAAQGQAENQTGRECRVSEHLRQCAQCAGTREAEQREGLAEASSSWGQAQLPAPTPDKERPGELAAFPPLGAPWRWGGLSVREAGALSNSATATAGQAAAWQPVCRRQGWRA